MKWLIVAEIVIAAAAATVATLVVLALIDK